MYNLLQTYYGHQKKLQSIASITSLLYRDQRVHLPSGASSTRGQHLGFMGGLYHAYVIDPDYVQTVNKLYDQQEQLSIQDRRSIQLAKTEIDKELRLPADFSQEYERIKSEAQSVWIAARKSSTFSMFAPYLQRVIEHTKRYAEYVDPGTDPYDVMVCEFEEDMTQEKYDTLLLPLKEPLKEIVHAHAGYQRDATYDITSFDKQQVTSFLKEMISRIGFDVQQGVFTEVIQPFHKNVGPGDDRISTRYENILEAIYSTLHETGHALYDRFTDKAFERGNLALGVSQGVHESQSRLLENMIGKHTSFINFMLPVLRTYAEAYVADRTEMGLYNYLRHIQPSAIRVKADEVSYNLHILLRYQLERDLFAGRLRIQDLPEAWNALMTEYIGITPLSDAEGCLQDPHWSLGYFGFFPTYFLGNLNAGQFFAAFQKDTPEWDKEIEVGNFSSYIMRFRHHVWQYGHLYTPSELLQKATGEPLRTDYFLHYLGDKYT